MKRHAPATARNSQSIADVLAQELAEDARVLEIASGSGEHAVFFAKRFPNVTWQPSDLDPEALASIDAYAHEAGLANLLPAIAVDAASTNWPEAIGPNPKVDSIVCINMVHISPWSASVHLFSGAAQVLTSGAPIILYGPFLEEDVETTPSNLAFDESLKSRDKAWGLRFAEAMDGLAHDNGFARTARHIMPANNLMLVYRKQG